MLHHRDTWGEIAAQVYGDSKLWPVIAHVNSIGDPRKLGIGQTLYIPDLLKISSNAQEIVTFTPMDYAEFRTKLKTKPRVTTEVTLENNLCYWCAAPSENEQTPKIRKISNQYGVHSGGDIISSITGAALQMGDIGTARVMQKNGQTFYHFAKGTLSQNKAVIQTSSQFKATIIRASRSGIWVTAFIYSLTDGLIETLNQDGNWQYGGWIVAKGTAKGALANMAGGAIGGGFIVLCELAGLATPPGWVIVIVSFFGGMFTLGRVFKIRRKREKNMVK